MSNDLSVSYFESWFIAEKRPKNPLSESEARNAYLNRERYVVVLSYGEEPRCYIEFGSNVLICSFLDRLKRVHLVYQFKEIKPSVLFLNFAVDRNFKSDSDKVHKGSTYSFKENGVVAVEEFDYDTRRRKTRQGEFDPEPNYEKYPEFGEYSSVTRIERLSRDS